MKIKFGLFLLSMGLGFYGAAQAQSLFINPYPLEKNKHKIITPTPAPVAVKADQPMDKPDLAVELVEDPQPSPMKVSESDATKVVGGSVVQEKESVEQPKPHVDDVFARNLKEEAAVAEEKAAALEKTAEPEQPNDGAPISLLARDNNQRSPLRRMRKAPPSIKPLDQKAGEHVADVINEHAPKATQQPVALSAPDVVVREVEIVRTIPVLQEVEVEVIKHVPAPHDTWRAVQGGDIVHTLEYWAEDGDVEFFWRADWVDAIPQSFTVKGSFEEAVQTLLDLYNVERNWLSATMFVDPKDGHKTLIIENYH